MRFKPPGPGTVVELADAGAGLDIDQVAVMPAVHALSGRGLAIIARVTDRLEVRR